MPLRDLLASVMFGSPVRRRSLPSTRSLIREQWRIGKLRAPERFSQREAYMVSTGLAGAEQLRDQGAASLAKLADQADGMRAQMAALHADAARLDEEPVLGVNGELLSAEGGTKRLEAVTAAVDAEVKAGSLKHRRVPKFLRHVAVVAPGTDFIPLLWFTAGVFNVDWSGLLEGQSVVQFATSIVFALLGSGAIALSLSAFGRDVKGYKDDQGHLRLPQGRAVTIPLLMVVLSTLVACGATVLMGYRVVSESVTAGSGTAAAVILGVFFGVIAFTLHVLVFVVHYRDGSTATDEMDCLAGQLEPIKRRRLQQTKRIDQLAAEVETVFRKAETIRDRTRTRLDRPVKGTMQLLLSSRSYHQGCSWSADLLDPDAGSLGLIAPVITIDTSILDRLMDRIRGEQAPPDEATADDEIDPSA